MEIKKAGILAVVALLGITFLGGCAQVNDAIDEMMVEDEWAPTQTTLEVFSDGSMQETVLEHLDQSYYDAGELETMVHATAEEYDSANGEDAVVIDELTVENEDVRLVMTYRDGEAYAGYNNVVFFNGSMLNAQMEGFLFENDFRKVQDGETTEETISNEEPLSHKEYQVLVTDTSHAVRMPSDVKYCSANAAVTGKRNVTPSAETEQEEQGLVLPSSSVYVEEQGETSDSDSERSYVYIIYEP